MAKKESSITNFNEHLTERYGARGTEKRTEFHSRKLRSFFYELACFFIKTVRTVSATTLATKPAL